MKTKRNFFIPLLAAAAFSLVACGGGHGGGSGNVPKGAFPGGSGGSGGTTSTPPDVVSSAFNKTLYMGLAQSASQVAPVDTAVMMILDDGSYWLAFQDSATSGSATTLGVIHGMGEPNQNVFRPSVTEMSWYGSGQYKEPTTDSFDVVLDPDDSHKLKTSFRFYPEPPSQGQIPPTGGQPQEEAKKPVEITMAISDVPRLIKPLEGNHLEGDWDIRDEVSKKTGALHFDATTGKITGTLGSCTVDGDFGIEKKHYTVTKLTFAGGCDPDLAQPLYGDGVIYQSNATTISVLMAARADDRYGRQFKLTKQVP